MDLAKLARKMATPRMADLRNVYTLSEAQEAGFDAYVSVGR
jgi:UDPglucose 6-dehydrogenase